MLPHGSATATGYKRPFLSLLQTLRMCTPQVARQLAHGRHAGQSSVSTAMTEANKQGYGVGSCGCMRTKTIHLQNRHRKAHRMGRNCCRQRQEGVQRSQRHIAVGAASDLISWHSRAIITNLLCRPSRHTISIMTERMEAGVQVRPPDLASGCPRPVVCRTCSLACMCSIAVERGQASSTNLPHMCSRKVQPQGAAARCSRKVQPQ